MAQQRYGVLIAASQFPKEPKLPSLRAPENDVDGLNEVLTAPALGAFHKVVVLKNLPSGDVLPKILSTLRSAGKNDMVLIYYSGHGKLSRSGRLHLTTSDTEIDLLEATSISTSRIHECIENTSCNKVVLILDCCFSGAAGKDFARGTLDDQLQMMSAGRGTYVLTSSTSDQIAQEKEKDQYGLFTKYVIEGIRSGPADLDDDGHVTMEELYKFVHARMLDEGFQEPMRWDINVRGEIVIAQTGKMPREERRKLIELRVTDLKRSGAISRRVMNEALQVNEESDLEGLDLERWQLLEKLADEKLGVGEFVEAWDKIGPRAELQRSIEEETRKRQIAAEQAKEAAAIQASLQSEAEQRAREEAARNSRRAAEIAQRAKEATRKPEPEAKNLGQAHIAATTGKWSDMSKREKWEFGTAMAVGVVVLAAFVWVLTLLPWGRQFSLGPVTFTLFGLALLGAGVYNIAKK